MQPDFSLIISLILVPILLILYFRLRLKKLAEYHSSNLGKIEVFEKYNKEKVLTINSFPEGLSIEDESINKSYFYDLAQKVLDHCKNISSPKILMLGLGANTTTSLIANKNPKIHQTIVEIDSQIIQACRDFFKLDKLPNYKLIQVDAFKLFDHKNDFGPFDAIIVDIFIGTPDMAPHKSNQLEYIKKLLKYLTIDGIILFNRPGNTQIAKDGSFKLKQDLEKVFKKVAMEYIEDPRRFKNYIITASLKKEVKN